MKKTFIYSILAVLAITACQMEQEVFVPEEPEAAIQDAKVFTATIEDDFNGATKTSLDGSGNVLWKIGDQVSIFAASTVNEHYQVSDASDGKTAATLNKIPDGGFVAGTDIDNNVAFYPYASTASIAKSAGNYVISGIELPATQNYATGSFGNGAFPMAAVTTSTEDMNLKFKNVLGGLKLQLKGTATITSITVTGNNNEILCGDAEVTVANGSTPSISLSDASAKTVTLNCGAGVALDSETATAFIIALPPMTMTGGFTVVVTDTESKQMEITTSKSQTIPRSNLLKMPAVNYVGTATPSIPVPSIIDLGLSVKWASFNIGASAPEEYGDYFAWGELDPYYEDGHSQDNPCANWRVDKTGYNWSSYKWYDESEDHLTKYNTRAADGPVDNITVLSLDDDVAAVKLGPNWRMPTYAELKELTNYCTREWITLNGINGIKATSKIPGFTDKWIFLPAAGTRNDDTLSDVGSIGYYWSSTLYGSPWEAYNLYLKSTTFSADYNYYRRYGRSIRPVNVLVDGFAPVSNIQIRAVEHLEVGENETLSTQVFPLNATNKTLTWTSSNPGVASVNSTGLVTAISNGLAVITATATDGSDVYATCNITVSPISTIPASVPVPDAIDLGLSVKWASFNLGASAPEEYGDYYAWGDIEPYYEDGHSQDNPCSNWKAGKTGYTWDDYKWYSVSVDLLTKYNSRTLDGPVDKKTKLGLDDDAAYMNLGSNWRMPTEAEITELINNCDRERTTVNGINGFRLTSTKDGFTDKSIFLPAAGKRDGDSICDVGANGYYWSSTLYGYSWEASYIYFYNNSLFSNSNYRRMGQSVRPVME